jgi:hypothetical protein
MPKDLDPALRSISRRRLRRGDDDVLPDPDRTHSTSVHHEPVEWLRRRGEVGARGRAVTGKSDMGRVGTGGALRLLALAGVDAPRQRGRRW